MKTQTRAAALAALAASLGWTVEKSKTGDIRKLTVSREGIRMRISWDGTRLTMPAIWREEDSDGKLIKRRQIPTMKEFTTVLRESAPIAAVVGGSKEQAILDKFRGKHIYWRNGLTGQMEDCCVPAQPKHYTATYNITGRWYITFAGTDTHRRGTGFRSVYVDSIKRVR